MSASWSGKWLYAVGLVTPARRATAGSVTSSTGPSTRSASHASSSASRVFAARWSRTGLS